MSDLALRITDQNGASLPLIDLVIATPDLLHEDGLETAVLISLFTDARADDETVLPDGSTDRRGWWGDTFTDIAGDQTGSLLWLLFRSKITREVLLQAEEYARDALQLLIDDGAARTVGVTVERRGLDGFAISVAITKADGRRWERQWIVQVGSI